jgi:hypothetical protein
MRRMITAFTLTSVLVYGRAASADGPWAVHARNVVRLGSASTVDGGGIAIDSAATASFALILERGARVDRAFRTTAAAVLLGDSAELGDVLTDRFVDQGGRHGALLPFLAPTPVDGFPGETWPPGDTFRVQGHQVLTIDSSHHGDIIVEADAILRLTSGIYHLGNISLGDGASLETLGPSEVRLLGRFTSGDRVRVGASPGKHTKADRFRIHVATVDVDNAPALLVGRSNDIGAQLEAPNGTISIGDNSRLRGSLTADTILFGKRVHLLTGHEPLFGGGTLCPPGSGAGAPCFNSANCGVGSCFMGEFGELVCSAPTAIEDANPCTLDYCSTLQTPQHDPLTGQLAGANDENPCNGVETCLNGALLHLDPFLPEGKQCDSSNLCMECQNHECLSVVTETSPLQCEPTGLGRSLERAEPVFANESRDHEVRIVASLPHSAAPTGMLYLTGNFHIQQSTDLGAHWTRMQWPDILEGNGQGCGPLMGAGSVSGDGDMVISYPGAIGADIGQQFAYASVIGGSGSKMFVIRSGVSGTFFDDSVQCVRFNPLPGTAVDDATVALTYEPTPHLWARWQEEQGAYLAVVPVDSDTGELGAPGTPTRMPDTGDDSDIPMDWGTCDHVNEVPGRGRLWGQYQPLDFSHNGLYITYSNNGGDGDFDTCADEVRRIYVEKLTGQNRFRKCIAQFPTRGECGSQDAPNGADPELVIDSLSRQIVVTYAGRADALSPTRIMLANSADGIDWSYQEVRSHPASDTLHNGDQSQPAVAVTSFQTSGFDRENVLKREASGVLFISWYEPASDPDKVTRYARGFFPLEDAQGAVTWIPSTAAFPLQILPSTGKVYTYRPVPLGFPDDPTVDDRGVYEFQGIAHAAGFNDGLGGWIASHTAPLSPTLEFAGVSIGEDPPHADDFFPWIATWK